VDVLTYFQVVEAEREYGLLLQEGSRVQKPWRACAGVGSCETAQSLALAFRSFDTFLLIMCTVIDSVLRGGGWRPRSPVFACAPSLHVSNGHSLIQFDQEGISVAVEDVEYGALYLGSGQSKLTTHHTSAHPSRTHGIELTRPLQGKDDPGGKKS
jgi:hypothetical protein